MHVFDSRVMCVSWEGGVLRETLLLFPFLCLLVLHETLVIIMILILRKTMLM